MEAEIVNKRSGLKITLFVLIGLIGLFLIYYSIMSVLSPARKMEELKNKFSVSPTEKTVSANDLMSDSTYLALLKEKSQLQSTVLMAETDSIYLTISLPDSIVTIGISGVTVHSAKMNEVKISRILTAGNEGTIFSMFSIPLSITNDLSTIRKDPILIKIAPKDTSEYIPDVVPDTSFTEPVNFILEMNNGIRIYIYQTEKEKFSDRKNLFLFDMNDRIVNTLNSIKSVATFKIPEYHPYIKLRLPGADAKIIYRALPKNGQIAVFW